MTTIRDLFIDQYNLEDIRLDGRCGRTGRPFRRAIAHAHHDRRLICFSQLGISNKTYWRDDLPTPTLIHEVAHCNAVNPYHGKAWKEQYTKLLEQWSYKPNRDLVKASVGRAVRDRAIADMEGHLKRLKVSAIPVVHSPEPVKMETGQAKQLSLF